VVSPEGISTLYKPKDRMAIYIIGQRDPYFNKTASKARICSQVVSLSTRTAYKINLL